MWLRETVGGMDLFSSANWATCCGTQTRRLRLWRCRSRKLLFDGPFERGFRLCAAHEDAIDEKTWCSADTSPQAILVILLNLCLILFSRNACLELLRVQLKFCRLRDQAVAVQTALIPKQEIVIFPELALLAGAPCGLCRALGEWMNLRYR